LANFSSTYARIAGVTSKLFSPWRIIFPGRCFELTFDSDEA